MNKIIMLNSTALIVTVRGTNVTHLRREALDAAAQFIDGTDWEVESMVPRPAEVYATSNQVAARGKITAFEQEWKITVFKKESD